MHRFNNLDAFPLQVFAFLSVTTTNVLATNSPQAPGISDKERKRRLGISQIMLAYTLCAALFMGLCTVLFLELFGPWLLALVGSHEEILGPASQYLRIRATASPAVMLVMVAQGACFGQQVGDAGRTFVLHAANAFKHQCPDEIHQYVKASLCV